MVLNSRTITQTFHFGFSQPERIGVFVVEYSLDVLKGEEILSSIHAGVLCHAILALYLETNRLVET